MAKKQRTFWAWLFSPITQRVLRMMGKLPHQQMAAWNKQADEIRPKRDEARRELDYLQNDERNLLEEGGRAAKAKNMTWQRQIAERLIRCRRDIKKAQAQLLIQDRQLTVLETRIHNASIKQVGETIDLPSAADLTQESAEAEMVMQELTEMADLATSVEVGAEDSYTASQSEEDILAEFAALAGEPDDTVSEPAAPIEDDPLYSHTDRPKLIPDHKAKAKEV
jgi:hypothetical protein